MAALVNRRIRAPRNSQEPVRENSCDYNEARAVLPRHWISQLRRHLSRPKGDYCSGMRFRVSATRIEKIVDTAQTRQRVAVGIRHQASGIRHRSRDSWTPAWASS